MIVNRSHNAIPEAKWEECLGPFKGIVIDCYDWSFQLLANSEIKLEEFVKDKRINNFQYVQGFKLLTELKRDGKL